ncbi:quinone oxidoreductase [Actinocorallia sp. B10E7]|uniref:quinone oxidoreductase family protein n=1 Tax=Actinocorallia sp. B10E7 TaxID=3153558 RepID=UPI00325EF207
MRAIVAEKHGGPEVLVPADLPDPVPGPGQLLVRVAAAGVNYIDTYHRTGRYETHPPFTPGVEVAGEVEAVGEGVTAFAPGDVVATADAIGGYAEKALVDQARAVPVPADVEPERAASVLLQGLTAHYLTHSTYAVQPGDTVLVHAAAGGMGLLLTQLVKLLGGRVIGTVSTPLKERVAREAGAEEVIGYEDFPRRVKDLTGGRGVPVVYDGVGAATFEGSLASLQPRGLLALYGAASGPVPPFDPIRLAGAGSLFLTRPTLAHYVSTSEELRTRAEDVFGWLAAGRLDVRVGERYPLAEARRAHEDLEARRTTGKLLLIP